MQCKWVLQKISENKNETRYGARPEAKDTFVLMSRHTMLILLFALSFQ